MNALLDWIVAFEIWPRDIGWKMTCSYGVLNSDWLMELGDEHDE